MKIGTKVISYLTQLREQLDYLRFPLGGMLKDKTREIAKES